MSHYEKLVIVILRVIGCCISVYALISMIYNAVSLLLSRYETFFSGIYAGFAYAIVGVALFALSKPLAILIAKRL